MSAQLTTVRDVGVVAVGVVRVARAVRADVGLLVHISTGMFSFP